MPRNSLYRHFDADGRLLYVGVSKNALARLNGHSQKSWIDDIASMTIEPHKSRDHVLYAEAVAIRDEKPLHNIAKPIPRDPDTLPPPRPSRLIATEGGNHWGYVLVGNGRPERDVQRRILTLSGCKADGPGTLWEDKLPARATRPQHQLTERNFLIGATMGEDRVHVATLLCLGVSGADVRWFIRKLQDKDVTVVIHDIFRDIGPGDDLEPLVKDFDNARNALHVRRSRAKKRKSGK